jgi:hypothetical protein
MGSVGDFDFYRGTKDASLRLAVPYGAGLPSHADPDEWNIMYATTTELAMLAGVVADIDKRGFSFYRLGDLTARARRSGRCSKENGRMNRGYQSRPLHTRYRVTQSG